MRLRAHHCGTILAVIVKCSGPGYPSGSAREPDPTSLGEDADPAVGMWKGLQNLASFARRWVAGNRTDARSCRQSAAA